MAGSEYLYLTCPPVPPRGPGRAPTAARRRSSRTNGKTRPAARRARGGPELRGPAGRVRIIHEPSGLSTSGRCPAANRRRAPGSAGTPPARALPGRPAGWKPALPGGAFPARSPGAFRARTPGGVPSRRAFSGTVAGGAFPLRFLRRVRGGYSGCAPQVALSHCVRGEPAPWGARASSPRATCPARSRGSGPARSRGICANIPGEGFPAREREGGCDVSGKHGGHGHPDAGRRRGGRRCPRPAGRVPRRRRHRRHHRGRDHRRVGHPRPRRAPRGDPQGHRGGGGPAAGDRRDRSELDHRGAAPDPRCRGPRGRRLPAGDALLQQAHPGGACTGTSSSSRSPSTSRRFFTTCPAGPPATCSRTPSPASPASPTSSPSRKRPGTSRGSGRSSTARPTGSRS